MATQFCSQCHQPISHVVAGVRLTAFKERLFRYIESHPGRSSIDLAQRFYEQRWDGQPNIIRSHIHQINDALMNTGVQISGHPWAGYRVVTGGSR